MAAFGALLGGVGQGALQYGQQVRGLLESRRHDFANLISQAAQTETDPETRAGMLKITARLGANEPIGKITSDFSKLLQKRAQDEQVLHQTIGPPPAQPQPQPAPAQAGETPGTGLKLPFFGESGPPAAQPATSPVQPISQTAQAAPSAGFEPIESIINRYQTRPEWGTPAGRQALQPLMNSEVQQSQELSRQAALMQMQLGERKRAYEEMDKSGLFKNMPDAMKAQYRAWASSTQAPFPALSPALMRPVNLPGLQPAASIPEEERVDQFGQPIDAAQNPYVRQHLDLLTGRSYYSPATGPTAMVAGEGGGLEAVAKLPGAMKTAGGGAALPPSALMPRPAGGVNAQGNPLFIRPMDLLHGGQPMAASGVTPPGLLPQVHSASSVQLPSGETVTTTETHRQLPGLPGAGGGSVRPVAPRAGATPPETPAWNPSNRTDSLIQQIANGDTTLDKAATTKRDKFEIETRMAQLGLSPANITTSMRERAENARLILGHLNDVDRIINQAEKSGELGVVATRWNDFLTNKLGDDPTKNHIFAQLSSNLGFLSTAVAMAHGGLRGGSSPTMVEHWEKALDAKDPETLKTKLAQARKWMEGYATLDQRLKRTESQGPGNVSPLGVPKVGESFGGGKVLSVERVQ